MNQVYTPAFDTTGYQVVTRDAFANSRKPTVRFGPTSYRFNRAAQEALSDVEHISVLVNTGEKALIVRPVNPDTPDASLWFHRYEGRIMPCTITAATFVQRLYEVMHWDSALDYRARGNVIHTQSGPMLLFHLRCPEAILPHGAAMSQ